MKKINQKYIAGERIVDCDICGFSYRFREMRKQRGFITCPDCFDINQSLDNKPKLRVTSKMKEVK